MAEQYTLDALIEALQIFRKYGNVQFPTHCEHDYLHVMVPYDSVSDEDKAKLDELGFRADEFGMFCSTAFGSA